MATNHNFRVKNGLEVGTGTIESDGTNITLSRDGSTSNRLRITNGIVHSDTDLSVTGDLAVSGNFNITGDINQTSVTTLDVTDLTITVANNAGSASNANNAGLIVDTGGSNPSLLYKSTGDKFSFNKTLEVNSRIETNTLNNIGNTANIIYRSSTNTIVGNNASALVVQDGGNVGIGTASPNSLADLHVADTSDARIWLDATSGSGNTLEIYAGFGTSIFNRSNSFLAFGVDNTEKMRINTGGNVGIRTTSPVTSLQINPTGGGYNLFFDRGNSTPGGSNPWLGLFNATTVSAATYGWGFYDSNSDGSLQIWNRNNSTTGAAALTIIRGGNVGIGMTSALNSKLNVFADGEAFRIDGTANTTRRMRFRNVGAGSGIGEIVADGSLKIYNEDANAYLALSSIRNIEYQVTSGNGTAGHHMFTSYNTEIMRIDGANNRVGIGTTAPTQKLHVAGRTLLDAGNFSATAANLSEAFSTYAVSILNRNGGANLNFSGNSTYVTIQAQTSTTAAKIISLNPFGGNVGIGTATPSEKLDVYGGNIQVGKATVNGDRYEVKVIGYDASQAYNVSLKTEYDGVYGRAGQIVTNDVSRFEINTTQSNAGILLHPGTGGVGIGLDSPSRELDIQASSGWAELALRGASGSSGSLEYFNASTKLAEIYADTSTNIIFRNSTGGTTERMRIDSSGNVGIGTTAPVAKVTLPLEEENGFKLAFKAASGNGHAGISTVDQNGAGLFIGANAYVNASGSIIYGRSDHPSSGIYFDGWNGDAMRFYTGSAGSPAERMRIDASGNVGIGTTSMYSGAKLSVAGSTVLANGNQFVIGTFGTAGLQLIGSQGGNNVVGTMGSSEALLFRMASQERMRIHTNGNIGIGTTAPTHKLNVVAASGTDVVQSIRNPSTSWSEYALTRYGTEGADTRYMDFGYYRGSNEATRGLVVKSQANATLATFLDSGNVGIGTTAPSFKLDVSGSGTVIYAGGTASNNEIVVERITTSPSKLQLQAYSSNPSIRFTANGNGRLRFLDSSDNERVSFLESGNVGIGESIPTEKLHVGGNIKMQATTAIVTYQNAANTWNIGLDAADASFKFKDGTAERMRIDASGNVGIGTTQAGNMHTNASKLVVGTGSGDQGMSVFAGTSVGRYAFARSAANNSDAFDGGMSYDGNRNLKFHTNANATRMTIDSSGNVIVGTTTNNYGTGKLTVRQTPGAPATTGTATTNVGLRVTTNTSNSQALDFGVYNASPYGSWIQAINSGDHSSTYPIILNPNGGNVGIGTTAPGQKLTVAGGVESQAGQGSVAFYSTTAGSYNQQNGASGTAWAYGATGGNSAPNTAASTTFGFHHWNGSAWSNPLNINTSGTVSIPGTLSVGTFAPTSISITSGTVKLDGDYPTGARNVALGDEALNGVSGGSYNVAIGSETLKNLTSGSNNTAVGRAAAQLRTTGNSNISIGSVSMYNTTTGSTNTAVGHNSLYTNTTGAGNVALGYQSLYYNTTASYTIAIGENALLQNTTGFGNVAVGAFSLDSNTTASDNTAVGYASLSTTQTGYGNTAVGRDALKLNTNNTNTAVGAYSLDANTTAGSNTAVGYVALGATTTGSHNTAVGIQALENNTTGYFNVAVGREALKVNTTSINSVAIGYSAARNSNVNNLVAIGYEAMLSTTSGGDNTAIGFHSLRTNTTGTSNTALGNSALFTNATGTDNTALGKQALYNNTGHRNTAVGINALYSNTTASNNLAFGREALYYNTTGADNTAIGYNASKNQTTASGNTTLGYQAQWQVSTGGHNTAIGKEASKSVVSGIQNVAVGAYANWQNTNTNNVAIGYASHYGSGAATQNVAVGAVAMFSVQAGGGNTAVGYNSQNALTNGVYNTAVGRDSAASNITGNYNVAIGAQSLYNSNGTSGNTAVGYNTLNVNSSGAGHVAIGEYTLDANTTGTENTGVGSYALTHTTTGAGNVAVGRESLANNTTASDNVAVGKLAMYTNTTGANNVVVGIQALRLNTTGASNTAIGAQALRSNTTADYNVAVGPEALYTNTTGVGNTAVGAQALRMNTGVGNSAFGTYHPGSRYAALRFNTTGGYNSAFGPGSLEVNTTGSNNTAMGYGSLASNTTGYNNHAFGSGALDSVTTANNNIGIGYQAGHTITTGYANTAIGTETLITMTTGHNNTAVGVAALRGQTNGGYSTAVGNYAGYHNNSTTGYNTLIGAHAGFGASGSTTASQVTAVGESAARLITTGTGNTALGFQALRSVTTSGYNTAVGWSAADALTTGSAMVALGTNAGGATTTGHNQTAIGYGALALNTTGSSSVAVGYNSLANATNGPNTAVGSSSLEDLTTGYDNTAVGRNAGANITTAIRNTAIGDLALTTNTTGHYNTAVGGYSSRYLTTGIRNTTVGYQAGENITTGAYNTFLGERAGTNTTTALNNTVVGSGAYNVATTGTNNVAMGQSALVNCTTGSQNTAIGYQAANDLTTGGNNTALGRMAMHSGTTVEQNVSLGYNTMYNSTTGYQVAVGANALHINTTGSQNVAVGYNAMHDNTTATGGTALGYESLANNTTGAYNTSIGHFALYDNTTGALNTAVGANALANNTTGNSSVAVGQGSLSNATSAIYNVAIGQQSLTTTSTGGQNVAVGYSTLQYYTGHDAVAIGAYAGQYATSGSNISIGSQAGRNYTTGGNNVAIGVLSQVTGQTNTYNTSIGSYALRYVTGNNNTALGAYAGHATTSGHSNVFIARDAGLYNTTGLYNIGVGVSALRTNVAANRNTAVGHDALYHMTKSTSSDTNNTALGFYAGRAVTSAVSDTFIGSDAGRVVTTGAYNTFVGKGSGYNATTGGYNTFVGTSSAYSFTTGNYNTSIGRESSYYLTTGSSNTALGRNAGQGNTTGNSNVAIGAMALLTSSTADYRVAVGANAGYYSTGASNIFLGTSSGYHMTTGANNTFLGPFSGNSNNLDLRTANSNIVLADGSGVPKMWIAGYSYRLGGGTENGTVLLSSVTTTSTSGGVGGANNLELQFMEPSSPNFGAKSIRLGVVGGGYTKMEFPGSGGVFMYSPYNNSDQLHLGYGGLRLDMLHGGYTTNENMLIRCVNAITFCSGGTGESARFDSSKNLLLGCTSAGDYGITLDPSPSGNSLPSIEIVRDFSGTSTYIRFTNISGSPYVGSITSTTSATAYNTSSDERLKESIVDAPSASEDIDAIQVRSFDWKVDGEHQKYGMVAQELLEVAPDAVSTGDTEDDMMGVDYSKLVPMLIKEIQELRKRVADLEE